MELIEISENQHEILDFCRQLARAGGVFLQDLAWGDFQKQLGKRVRRFAVLDDDRKEVLLFAQTIEYPAGKKKYLFAPFGPIFANKISAEEHVTIFDFFVRGLQDISKELMFLRFESEFDLSTKSTGSLIRKTIDLNPHQTLVLDLKQNTDQLLAEMKPKTRYNIRLAEKSGIEVRVMSELPTPIAGGEDPIAVSAARAGIHAYTHGYFNELLKFFSNENIQSPIQARCYAAYHDGDLLATNIIIEYGGRATYLFGGALDLKRNLMPSYALHWQAIRDAKIHGCEIYDFWGVETDERHPWYGFSKFKFGFGGQIIKRPGTEDFVYNPTWYNVYVIFRKLNRLKRASFRH